MADLAGPAPTPLERLCAERVALRWVGAQLAESHYAAFTEGTFKESEHRIRMVGAANRRLLQAMATLAMIQKLVAARPRVVEATRNGDGVREPLPAESREAILARAGLG